MLLVGTWFDFESTKISDSIESSMLSSIGGAACYAAGALFVSLILIYLLPRNVRQLLSNITNNMAIEEEIEAAANENK